MGWVTQSHKQAVIFPNRRLPFKERPEEEEEEEEGGYPRSLITVNLPPYLSFSPQQQQQVEGDGSLPPPPASSILSFHSTFGRVPLRYPINWAAAQQGGGGGGGRYRTFLRAAPCPGGRQRISEVKVAAKDLVVFKNLLSCLFFGLFDFFLLLSSRVISFSLGLARGRVTI